jgi:hypothetical protein
MAEVARKQYLGTLLRLDRVGLGIIVADSTDADSTEKEFAFTFDKIDGYKGEPLKNLGLSEGAIVKFTLDAENRVSSVSRGRQAQGKDRVNFGFDKVFSLGGKVF